MGCHYFWVVVLDSPLTYDEIHESCEVVHDIGIVLFGLKCFQCRVLEHLTPVDINKKYFQNRHDGMQAYTNVHLVKGIIEK